MRKWGLWINTVIILVGINWLIVAKERTLATGSLMLLDMAPRDPRSIMQGDYMTLRYRLAQDIEHAAANALTADGNVIVTLDQNKVAQFVRIDQAGVTLANNEYRLKYRIRNGRAKLATDAYFFQEGQGQIYATARYGKFRVDQQGDTVLIGLCDAQWKAIPQPAGMTDKSCLNSVNPTN